MQSIKIRKRKRKGKGKGKRKSRYPALKRRGPGHPVFLSCLFLNVIFIILRNKITSSVKI